MLKAPRPRPVRRTSHHQNSRYRSEAPAGTLSAVLPPHQTVLARPSHAKDAVYHDDGAFSHVDGGDVRGGDGCCDDDVDRDVHDVARRDAGDHCYVVARRDCHVVVDHFQCQHRQRNSQAQGSAD